MGDTTIRDTVNDIFNSMLAGDFDGFIKHWHEDCVYTFPGDNSVGGDYHGHDGQRTFWEKLGSKLPDMGFEIAVLFVEGDEAAVEWRDWGVNPEGAKFESWGVTRFTFVDGKVKVARDLMDTQKMRAVLGP